MVAGVFPSELISKRLRFFPVQKPENWLALLPEGYRYFEQDDALLLKLLREPGNAGVLCGE